MIASSILLNAPLTTRTLLRRLQYQLLTRHLLLLLDLPVRPVLVLPACLLLVPRHVMLDTMTLPASDTCKLGRWRGMHMPALAAFEYTPCETRDCF